MRDRAVVVRRRSVLEGALAPFFFQRLLLNWNRQPDRLEKQAAQ
jgi:hypothetical protein